MINLLENTRSLIRRNPGLTGIQKCIRLTHNQTCCFCLGKKPLHVTGITGVIWVTVQKDPQDYFLEPGQELTIYKRGLVVAEGFPDGSFLLQR